MSDRTMVRMYRAVGRRMAPKVQLRWSVLESDRTESVVMQPVPVIERQYRTNGYRRVLASDVYAPNVRVEAELARAHVVFVPADDSSAEGLVIVLEAM